MDVSSLLQTLSQAPGLGAFFAVVWALLVLAWLLKALARRRSKPSLRKMLRLIRRTHVEPIAILNRPERQLHRDLSLLVDQSGGFALQTQVSMGEFLRVDAKRATNSKRMKVFNTFNAKRVDFLIVDADWLPWVVIEYQGTGHNIGNAYARDAIKRALLKRAGIPLIEVAPDGLTRAQLRELRGLLNPRRGFAAA